MITHTQLKIFNYFTEPSLVLHCLKVPQFLQRMEARAREREEKHAIIRERRKQMEEERIRLKQQVFYFFHSLLRVIRQIFLVLQVPTLICITSYFRYF